MASYLLAAAVLPTTSEFVVCVSLSDIVRIDRGGDDVYVRSASGRGSSWFRGTQHRHEARICAGVEKDVSLVETDAAKDEVDAAYQAKNDCPNRRSCRGANLPTLRSSSRDS